MGNRVFPPLEGRQIVEKVREFVGTPWHHDARLKGVGIDCSGLVICTFKELGVKVRDVRGYGMGDEFPKMRRAVSMWCDEVGIPYQAGDIFVFRSRLMSNHMAIYSGPTDNTIIHAYSSPSIMRVCEQPFDESWFLRIESAWRYRGVK